MITTITNGNLTAQIKHLGAELCSLKNENTEYIWSGNPEFWGKHSPVLFPIVGTLKDNCYFYKNKKYELSRHGFARDMNFDLIGKTKNSATFSLKSSEKTFKNYPFAFELQLIYTLTKNRLTLQYNIKNNGKTQMPFCIGAHPAFALPENFENYWLQFQENELLIYNLLENDLLSDKTKKLNLQNNLLSLNYKLFENDALVFKKLESKSITILENSNPKLKITFDDFPSLGIWTKVNAPFLCIEPWLGYADTTGSNGTILEKEGVLILDENKNFNAQFSIEVL